MRDPLVAAYNAIKAAVRTVHGSTFVVRDEEPNPIEFKAVLPAANISKVSGTAEKALMREYEPHGILDNGDGTWTVGTESLRFDYMIQVSFYADRHGSAQKLVNEFMASIEVENELPIPGDKWGEIMQIFTSAPPLPPRGQVGFYQCDVTLACRGKLITEEIVSSIDVSQFKPQIGNL